ncbi:MAG: hypothetical protein QME52_14400 [Bacteroidota bacterium]|nr:hypothetical protein [Bacteroidota bacterium]
MGTYKVKTGENIHQLKVTFSDPFGRIKGHPYRVLAIPGDFSLADLADNILESFDFDFDHLYGFYDNIKHWTKSRERYELSHDMWEDTESDEMENIKVSKVFHTVKKKMLFLYDYGDEWHFIVELERIETAQAGKKYPLVVESLGDAQDQYGGMEEEF